jgi:peptide deformylase
VADSAHPIVLVAGDPRLRRAAPPVVQLDVDVAAAIAALGAALAAFRATHGFGRGIAAPQLGINQRIVVLDLGAGPLALINPEITWRDPELFEVWDDCFSVPDQLVRVQRHRSISLRWHDQRFRLRQWERLPPDLAELLQHELDHLDGVLMTDRADGPDALRPLAKRAQLVDAARPQHRLSPAAIALAAHGIDPVFRNTPQYECEPLSAELGCRLLLKVETLNPIRSFKGRGADHFVNELLARGERGPLVCASAGNFGQALAYVCRRHGIGLTVFAAHGANALKLSRMRALGADVRISGADFDAAKDAARAHAAHSGARMVEDGREAAISIGAGTIALELFADDAAIAAVLIPLGNGALINGMARWIRARSPATRVIGVVARGAPAMALSWRTRSPVATTHIDTIADGIGVRVPVAEAVADMPGLVDEVLEVDDAALIAAMRLAHQHAGLVVEPAGVAGLAGVLVARERFTDQTVATVLAGGNLTPEQISHWLQGNTP